MSCIGLQGNGEPISFPVDDVELGSIGMLCLVIGLKLGGEGGRNDIRDRRSLNAFR
jgi:hypothetical protein